MINTKIQSFTLLHFFLSFCAKFWKKKCIKCFRTMVMCYCDNEGRKDIGHCFKVYCEDGTVWLSRIKCSEARRKHCTKSGDCMWEWGRR